LSHRQTDTFVMTSPRPELPHDLARCHVVIEQLHAELQRATEQIAQLKSVSEEARNSAARIAHLEALLTEHQETIAAHEETIENLAADNRLLKRSLFGSRRERYTDDPGQALLFEAAAEDTTESEDGDEAPAEPKKKRTSKGRQRRVFPKWWQRLLFRVVPHLADRVALLLRLVEFVGSQAHPAVGSRLSLHDFLGILQRRVPVPQLPM